MSMDQLAIVLFVLTIVERFAELFVSNRNAAWSFARGGVEFGRDHYKWMVLMHSAFLVAMLLEFYQFGPSISSGPRGTAMVVVALCQAMRWWVISTLGSQWNTRVIVVPGLARVTGGPYRYFRHPNYLIVAVETVALPLIFGSWRTAIVFSILNALMMRVRIQVENDALRNLKS